MADAKRNLVNEAVEVMTMVLDAAKKIKEYGEPDFFTVKNRITHVLDRYSQTLGLIGSLRSQAVRLQTEGEFVRAEIDFKKGEDKLALSAKIKSDIRKLESLYKKLSEEFARLHKMQMDATSPELPENLR